MRMVILTRAPVFRVHHDIPEVKSSSLLICACFLFDAVISIKPLIML